MKKKFCFLLSALSAAILLVALTLISSAETTEPTLKIEAFNLMFKDSVYIRYAVSSNVDGVELLVWTSPQTDYTIGTETDTLKVGVEGSVNNIDCTIFDYKELAARNMTDNVYARAHVKVGDRDYYSPLCKYSILQYAYNKLGKTGTATTSDTLKVLLSDMLTYGASAQKHFGYKSDRLATADWYQVKVVGGLLDDGCNQGLYLEGDKVKITAPETDADGNTFAYWTDIDGKKVGTTATLDITVGRSNNSYSANYQAGLKYTSNGDGTCYVSGIGTCTGGEITIPSTSPNGYTVVGIGEGAFKDSNITDITIPSTVKTIGENAFDGCSLLVTVNYNAQESDWNAIEIADGNEALENATKYFNDPESTSLFSYTVNEDGTTCTIVGLKNKKLTEVTIPAVIDGYKVTVIDAYSLKSGTALTTVTIPNSVTKIPFAVFCCFQNVYYNGSLTEWLNIECRGANVSVYEDSALYIGGKLVKDVVIPDGVESINYYSFWGCASIESVTFPKSMTDIPASAFALCPNLSSISVASANSVYHSADNCVIKTATKTLVLGCKNSVIPTDGSVTSIGYSSFYGATKLTGIVIPKNVTSIRSSAFQRCLNLESITLHDGITTIEALTFSGCFNLKSITLSSNVTTIEMSAFNECNALTDVYYSGTEEQWKRISIDDGGNAKLTSATIHYGVQIETPSVDPTDPTDPVDTIDITVIDATGGASGENKTGDIATVSKKYFAVSYTMTASTYAGAVDDNGCCGLYFGDDDNTCIYIPYDGGTTATQRKIGIFDGNNVVFGNWWGSPKIFEGTASVSITPDTEVTILALGVKNSDGTTTVTAYVNGGQVNVWGNTTSATGSFNGKLSWATKLAGQKATVKFAESDDPISSTVFD